MALCSSWVLDDWLWPSRPSYLWYPVAIQSQKFGSCCATGSWHEVVLFGPAAQWVHGWKFHSWGETMGPTGPTHLGMCETGVYLQFVGTSTYHVFCFQSSFILIFGQKCSSLADFPAVWDVCFRHLRWKSLAKPAHLGPRGVQPAPLIYHSGSSVILQKGYLNPRSTLEVSYIYHAYLSSKWGPKQSFTRVDQAG